MVADPIISNSHTTNTGQTAHRELVIPRRGQAAQLPFKLYNVCASRGKCGMIGLCSTALAALAALGSASHAGAFRDGRVPSCALVHEVNDTAVDCVTEAHSTSPSRPIMKTSVAHHGSCRPM